MKTTVLKQGNVTYERDADCLYSRWKSYEFGVKVGEVRVIEDVLHYASSAFGIFPLCHKHVYWSVVKPEPTPTKARK